MIEVVAREPVKSTLKALLADVEADVCLICIDVCVISPVLVRSHEGKAIVLLGWRSLEYYFDLEKKDLEAALKNLRIVFRRLPVGKQEILDAIAEATK